MNNPLLIYNITHVIIKPNLKSQYMIRGRILKRLHIRFVCSQT